MLQQVKAASAFPGFLGSQGDRGGGQVQGKKQVEASSFGHCGMFWGAVPALRSSDFCGWDGASAAEGGPVTGSTSSQCRTGMLLGETETPEHRPAQPLKSVNKCNITALCGVLETKEGREITHHLSIFR